MCIIIHKTEAKCNSGKLHIQNEAVFEVNVPFYFILCFIEVPQNVGGVTCTT